MTAPYRLRAEDLAARGGAVALASRAAEVTYAELAARAADVRGALRRVGVTAGDRVALLSSGRAHDEPVALVGALTAGAVVVPLDATAPPARLARMARARGCRALVIDAAAAGLADAIVAELGEGLARVTLDEGGRVLRGEERAAASAGRDEGAGLRGEDAKGAGPGGDAGQEIACILHTSGSTGEPKPVPITWAGLDAFTAWGIDLIGLSPADRVLRVAELLFDLSWFDHLATFRAGATLVTMARRDLASGRALRDAVAALAPTVIYGVPSMFMKLVAALPAAEAGAPAAVLSPPVRAILFAGEVFPPRELAALAARAPSAELYNLYGPTETNVCTAHHVDRAALDGASEIPIGRACPYATCTLVAEDGSGRVIEGPGTGELVVSGPTTMGGGPYHTRDRVERKADGLFYFRGRIDRMVKVRGYRVEPGEVEAALSSHPAVRQAAVIAVEDARLGKTLRAFVALAGGDSGGADDRALRMYLAERLPPYMVPDKIVTLDELPRTSTGKIDYRALG